MAGLKVGVDCTSLGFIEMCFPAPASRKSRLRRVLQARIALSLLLHLTTFMPIFNFEKI
jgi:hypothetical protein